MQHNSQFSTHTHLHIAKAADRAVAAFIATLFGSRETPVIIAIGGPGGSGKTTFAKKLQRHLKNCGVLHLDNYKTSRAERQQRGLAGPHPEANQMDLVVQHLQQIRSGNCIAVPVYDNETGDTGHYEQYPSHAFTIIEGEIATYRPFRHLIDISLFIDSDFKTQLAARTGRDVIERGHSLKKAITTFLTSNLTEFTNHGADSKEWADIHLFCHADYHYSLESVRSTLCTAFKRSINEGVVIEPDGLIVPVATPFERDLSLCQSAFIDHLSWLSSKGVKRTLIGGTTAEFFSLSVAERLTLLKLAREYFPGLILFNISGDSLASTLELAEHATRYGADALICLPPYYYADAPADGLADYFTRVAKSCKRPLYLYNFPKHTGNPLTPALLNDVAHAGIKDSSADLSLIPHSPSYLLGGDANIIEAFAAGARGFIPGLPNAFPEHYIRLEEALLKGEAHTAQKLVDAIEVFKQSLPKVSGIVVIKQYLHKLLGAYPVTVRPPLSNPPPHLFTLTTTLI